MQQTETNKSAFSPVGSSVPNRAVRGLEMLLWAAAGIAGLLLTLRAALGPFDFPLHVYSPRVLQTIIGVGMILLWALRSIPGTTSSEPVASLITTSTDPPESLSRPTAIWMIVILAVTVIAFTPALDSPFVSDDYFQIRHAQTLDLSTLVRD